MGPWKIRCFVGRNSVRSALLLHYEYVLVIRILHTASLGIVSSSRLVHGREVHAGREPERICIEHRIVRIEELVVHAVEHMPAIVRRQSCWAGEGRVL
jgi:hypothetical protein